MLARGILRDGQFPGRGGQKTLSFGLEADKMRPEVGR